MAIPMARARKRVQLQKRKRELEAELRKVNGQIAQEDEVLIDRMTHDGAQSLNVEGMTLYLRLRRSAKLRDGATIADAKAALEELGYGDIVKPYTQSVTALFNEWADAGEEAPKQLSALYEITEIPQLGHRSG